jgi:preprotein translocase subunit SecE
VSDEGDVAEDAASDGGQTEDSGGSGGRTAVVTKSVTRPQRPAGKRLRQRAADTSDTEEEVDGKQSSTEVEDSTEASGTKKARQVAKAKTGPKTKKPKKSSDRPANPFLFVYTYLKQVVAEMRKVIWPNRKQMLTYTSVVLAFLAFMVALVGLADLGLTKLVMLVFG